MRGLLLTTVGVTTPPYGEFEFECGGYYLLLWGLLPPLTESLSLSEGVTTYYCGGYYPPLRRV